MERANRKEDGAAVRDRDCSMQDTVVLMKRRTESCNARPTHKDATLNCTALDLHVFPLH